MLIDQTFPAVFEFDVLDELPVSNKPRFYLPRGDTAGGRDGPTVRFAPADGAAWLGTFAFGDFGQSGFSGIFTMPDPHRLCVVTKGTAYIANAMVPGFCEVLAFGPVTDLRIALRHRLLVFAGYTELLALGADGIAWRTERIGWDKVKLKLMSDDFVRGTCWDLRSESEVDFTVDLASGRHSGGSSFPT